MAISAPGAMENAPRYLVQKLPLRINAYMNNMWLQKDGDHAHGYLVHLNVSSVML